MNTFFVINFLDGKPELGAHAFDERNLHVTFLAHAWMDDDRVEAEFIRRVGEVAAGTRSFDLLSKEMALFGVNEDKPVFKMFPSVWASKLHNELLSVAHDLNLWLREPQFTGENFAAHISVPVLDARSSSKFAAVDSLSVVKHVGGYGVGAIEVVANFDLKRTLLHLKD